MKAWVKKKPLTQKTLGEVPLFIQSFRKEMRSSRSFTQEPKGFSDG